MREGDTLRYTGDEEKELTVEKVDEHNRTLHFEDEDFSFDIAAVTSGDFEVV